MRARLLWGVAAACVVVAAVFMGLGSGLSELANEAERELD